MAPDDRQTDGDPGRGGSGSGEPGVSARGVHIDRVNSTLTDTEGGGIGAWFGGLLNRLLDALRDRDSGQQRRDEEQRGSDPNRPA